MKRFFVLLALAAFIMTALPQAALGWGSTPHRKIMEYCRKAWGYTAVGDTFEGFANKPDTWGNFNPPSEEDGSDRGLSSNTPDEHAALWWGSTFLGGTAHRNASAYARHSYKSGKVHRDSTAFAAHYLQDIFNPYHTTLGHQFQSVPQSKYYIYDDLWYSWQTASTSLSLGDDAGAWVSLSGLSGGKFKFYGTEYTQVYVCSNGFLSFVHANNSTTPTSIPSSTDPDGLVAPFWRDLNPAAGGTIKYTVTSTQAVFSWESVPNYANANKQTFQIILKRCGGDEDHILFQYKSITKDITTGVGVENSDGSKGASYSRDNLYNLCRVIVSPLSESDNNHYGYENWVNNNWTSGYRLDTVALRASGAYWHTDNIKTSVYNWSLSNSYNYHDALCVAYETSNWSKLFTETKRQIEWATLACNGLVEYARARAAGGTKGDEPTREPGLPMPIPDGMTYEEYLASLEGIQSRDVDPSAMISAAPNPVRDGTTIRFNLNLPANVSLRVYNISGQLIKTVVSETKPAGCHSAAWDGKDANGKKVAAGVYLYRLVAGDYSATRKLTVLR